MSDHSDLIHRVRQALRRLGYTHIEAEDLGAGKIRLSGRIRNFDERALMVAAVRTVSGVTSVSLKLSV